MALSNGGHYLQTVLNSALKCFFASCVVTTMSALVVQMFFYCIAIVKKAIQARTVKSFCIFSTKMLLVYTVQKIPNA